MTTGPGEPPTPSADPPEDAAGGQRRAQSLGDRAAVGFAYMLALTMVVRVVRFGGQLLLAWLLIPDDFALFGLAVTLHQFVSVLKNAGLRDILIHRQARVHLWVNAAFWMTVLIGLLGGGFMFAAAPAVASFFDRPELIPLVHVLAWTTLAQSIAQVPNSLIYAQLRFKTAAVLEAAHNVLLMGLTVLLAWTTRDPISFVLPMLVLAVVRVVVAWMLTRPRIRLDLQLRRWRYMISDSLRLISVDIGRTVAFQGDYVVMGRAFPDNPAVGHYFFGFQMSNMVVLMFGRNIDTVLFPSLSHIRQDAARQSRAFLRALRMMTIIGMPLCFMQAAAAEPAVLAVLPERFHPSIPFIVWLSIGMAPRFVVSPCSAMLRAQGRFRMLGWLTWAWAASVVGLASLAAWLGGPIAVASGVSVALVFSSLAFVYATLHGSPRPLAQMAGVFAWPTLIGGLASGAGWLVSEALPDTSVWWQVIRVATVVAVAGAIYVPSIALADRRTCGELIDRLGRLLPHRFRRRSGGPVGDATAGAVKSPGTPG